MYKYCSGDWLSPYSGMHSCLKRRKYAPLSPWLPGNPGFPGKPGLPVWPGSPRAPWVPGGPAGPGGPGELLRYPEGIWLSITSILLIWPAITVQIQADLGELSVSRNVEIPRGSKDVSLTAHKLFTNLSGNGTHHVLGCKVSLGIKDSFMRTWIICTSLIYCMWKSDKSIPSLPFLL